MMTDTDFHSIDTPEEPGLPEPEDGMGISGQIVMAMVSQGNVLTDQLIANERSETLAWAKDFLALYTAVQEATQQISLRSLDEWMDAMSSKAETAKLMIQEATLGVEF